MLTISALRVCVAVVFAMCFLARPAAAQGMSFSVYTDGGISGSTLVSVSNVADNSWGCSHYNYLTTSQIASPSNRIAQTQSSGLNASTSLSIDDEDGNFTISTSGSYNCSCIKGSQAGFGGGVAIGIKSFRAVFQKSHFNSLVGKWEYHANAAVCNGVCQPAKWCSTQECNWLYINGYKANTGAFTYCQPRPPFPQCSATQPQCKMDFGAVIWNPNGECDS